MRRLGFMLLGILLPCVSILGPVVLSADDPLEDSGTPDESLTFEDEPDDPGEEGPLLPEASALIRAVQARQLYQVDGNGLTVAVISSGLRRSHADFSGRVVQWRNFAAGGDPFDVTDTNGVGTAETGIIAASPIPNGVHTGIAPGANIIALKTATGDFFRDDSQALQWVLDNRSAFNISVVLLNTRSQRNHTDDTGLDQEGMRSKIQALRAINIPVVAPAGNDFFGVSSNQGMAFPAILRETVSVGAVYEKSFGRHELAGAIAFTTGPDRICAFSQRLHESVNPFCRTDIFAPGSPIRTSDRANDRASGIASGTGYAASITAGAVLLLQQHYLRARGTLPPVDQIEAWLRSGAVAINDGDDEDDNVTNTGLNFLRLDVLGALAATGIPPSPPFTMLFGVGLGSENVGVRLYDVGGARMDAGRLLGQERVKALGGIRVVNGSAFALIFAIGLDDAVWVRPIDGIGYPTRGWASTGRDRVKAISVGKDFRGDPLLFAIGLNDAVWLRRFDGNGRATSGWFSPGSDRVKAISVGEDAAGNPLLFAIGLNDGIWMRPFDGNGNPRGGWVSLGVEQVKAVSVGKNGSGNPLLFAIGLNDGAWIRRLDGNGNPLGGWISLGAERVKAISAARDSGGNPLLFVIGLDDRVWLRRFDGNGNPITGWFLGGDGVFASISSRTE